MGNFPIPDYQPRQQCPQYAAMNSYPFMIPFQCSPMLNNQWISWYLMNMGLGGMPNLGDPPYQGSGRKGEGV